MAKETEFSQGALNMALCLAVDALTRARETARLTEDYNTAGRIADVAMNLANLSTELDRRPKR